jgi:hypothetical protein
MEIAAVFQTRHNAAHQQQRDQRPKTGARAGRTRHGSLVALVVLTPKRAKKSQPNWNERENEQIFPTKRVAQMTLNPLALP